MTDYTARLTNRVRLLSACRGAVFVEHLIALLPVIYFFFSTWQLLELFAADLVLQRAANAAVRAAIVVLPDDPFYLAGDGHVDAYAGEREQQVRLAAELVLMAAPHFEDPVDVKVTGTLSEHNPIEATVTAAFRCSAGWLNLVCGGRPSRQLTASATHVYQGARYSYDAQ